MTKLTPEQKAKRRKGKAIRNAEKQQRKEQSENTRRQYDGIGRLIESVETRSAAEPSPKKKAPREDFSQAAARIVRETTKD